MQGQAAQSGEAADRRAVAPDPSDPPEAPDPPVVVLVGTSHPGNVGAIARAAANFGVQELRFVAPRCDIHADEAMGRAKHARELLRAATVCATLDEALVGTSMAVGTTARTTTADNRHLRKTLDVRDWAEGLEGAMADGWDGRLALVFGREDSGLTADEVNRCDQLVTVPTADYASLNLAHAVALLCYEHLRVRQMDRITAERTLAPDTLRAMTKAWDDVVEQVEPRKWRRDVASGIFRKIVGRSHPDDHEVHNIMGILAGVLRRFDHPDYRTAKSSRVLKERGLLAEPVAAEAGGDDGTDAGESTGTAGDVRGPAEQRGEGE